jgi:hypothetical protein
VEENQKVNNSGIRWPKPKKGKLFVKLDHASLTQSIIHIDARIQIKQACVSADSAGLMFYGSVKGK